MSKIKVFESIIEFINFRKGIHPDIEMGLVPTMGALHQGHGKLLRQSVEENDLTILSVFINPTQFNETTDFEKYPKSWTEDLALATAAGVDFVIAPNATEIYADKYRFKVSENLYSKKLCGLHRPGHFDGVLTIVMKLLMFTRSKRAYFGEKDYQQLQLIKDMVSSFFIPTEIVACPTVRESNGLAMSSRNLRLSKAGYDKASFIYKYITQNLSVSEVRKNLEENGFTVDYIEDEGNRRFVAATMEGIRLIDNVEKK